ncbi:MAG TPA: hypothetical protein VGV60_07685 [Candidatus Polarisedimenticolia bacterium]|nr:hypothetical protein [Candidatus Polarisedimenticolia bacterium]
MAEDVLVPRGVHKSEGAPVFLDNVSVLPFGLESMTIARFPPHVIDELVHQVAIEPENKNLRVPEGVEEPN